MRKSFPKKRFPQIDFLLQQSPFTFYIFQIEIYGGNLSEEIEYKGNYFLNLSLISAHFARFVFIRQNVWWLCRVVCGLVQGLGRRCVWFCVQFVYSLRANYTQGNALIISGMQGFVQGLYSFCAQFGVCNVETDKRGTKKSAKT